MIKKLDFGSNDVIQLDNRVNLEKKLNFEDDILFLSLAIEQI